MAGCTEEFRQSSMVPSKTDAPIEDVVTPAFVKSEIEKDPGKIEEYLEALIDWKLKEPTKFAQGVQEERNRPNRSGNSKG
jgi:hypothetical protein